MTRRRWLIALGAGGLAVAVGYLSAEKFLHSYPAAPALNSLPAFSLPTTDGEAFSSETLSGRITILNFWATWCAPCRKEIPLLIATQAIHASTVTVIGIAIDDLEAVRPFEDEIGLDYVSLIGKTEGISLMSAFGNPGHLPFTLVFDPAGRLIHRKTGELSASDIQAWLKTPS